MLRIFIYFLIILSSPLYAASVIFGDSLADEGRVYQLTDNAFPPFPYAEGRFTNGPVWPEYLSGDRINYAVGGAKTNNDNILENSLGDLVANTGLRAQVTEYLATKPLPSDMAQTQYYIQVGGNDFFSPAFSVRESVDNIIEAAARLRAAGATQILLIGLPDLAIAPYANDYTLIEQQALTAISLTFNLLLSEAAEDRLFGYFDLFHFVDKITRTPRKYGLKNVDDACLDELAGTVCNNPEEYLFWDDVHPTMQIHQLLAAELE